jgi:hypothetical protein
VFSHRSAVELAYAQSSLFFEPGGVQFARAGPLLNSDGPDNLARSSQKKTGIRGQDYQAQLSTIVVAARVVREVGSNERKVSSSPRAALFWGPGNACFYRLPSPSYWQGSQTLGSRNSSVKPLDVAI